MDISMRSVLAAGITAVTATAIVAAPTITPLPAPHAAVMRPVELSAAVQPLSRQEVSAALTEIGKYAASAALPTAAGDVSVQNTASDAVTAAYEFILTYTDYFFLELAPYILQFVPFGWIISNQIGAIYPPVNDFTDSIVYQLVVPVLNDPLNLAVWANGISAVAYTGVASLLNVGINEVNLAISYFLSWIPPLPPIPPWPPILATATATKAATATVGAATLAAEPSALTPLAKGTKAASAPIKDVAGAATTTVADTAKTVVDTVEAAAVDTATSLVDTTTDIKVAQPHTKGAAAPDTATSSTDKPAAAPDGAKKAGKSGAKSQKAAKSAGSGSGSGE